MLPPALPVVSPAFSPPPCRILGVPDMRDVTRRVSRVAARNTGRPNEGGVHGARTGMSAPAGHGSLGTSPKSGPDRATRRTAATGIMLRTLLTGLLVPLLVSQPRVMMAEMKLGDDEFELEFGEGPIGLDLIEVRFPAGVPAAKQSSRVIIDAVKPGSQAEKAGQKFRLRPQLLLVAVNGQNVEGLPAKEVIKLVVSKKKEFDEYEGVPPLRLVFRDPLIFKEKLLNSDTGTTVQTQVGVMGSDKLIVNVTKVPEVCGAIRSQQGDVLEVKYTGYLAETMEIFDGSSINAQGNYFGDSSLYFVLNQVRFLAQC